MLEEANQVLQSKDYRRAQALYRAALGNREDQALVRQGLCVSSYFLQQYENAESDAREALRLRSALHMPHRILAYILARRGEYAGAYAEIAEALRLEPHEGEARAFAGGLLVTLGRVDEARQMFLESRSPNNDGWLLHFNLGLLYLREGDRVRASSEYWKAFRKRASWQALGAWLSVNAGWLSILFGFIYTGLIVVAYSLPSVVLLLLTTTPVILMSLLMTFRKVKSALPVLLGSVAILIGFYFVRR